MFNTNTNSTKAIPLNSMGITYHNAVIFLPGAKTEELNFFKSMGIIALSSPDSVRAIIRKGDCIETLYVPPGSSKIPTAASNVLDVVCYHNIPQLRRMVINAK